MDKRRPDDQSFIVGQRFGENGPAVLGVRPLTAPGYDRAAQGRAFDAESVVDASDQLFRAQLKQALERHGLTFEQLSEKAKEVGTAHPSRIDFCQRYGIPFQLQDGQCVSVVLDYLIQFNPTKQH